MSRSATLRKLFGDEVRQADTHPRRPQGGKSKSVAPAKPTREETVKVRLEELRILSGRISSEVSAVRIVRPPRGIAAKDALAAFEAGDATKAISLVRMLKGITDDKVPVSVIPAELRAILAHEQAKWEDDIARLERELHAVDSNIRGCESFLRLKDAERAAPGAHPGMGRIGKAVVMTATGGKGHAFRASERSGGVASKLAK